MMPVTIQPSPVCRYVGAPAYGNQDVGVAPGGAMDRFSFYTANAVLQNPPEHPCLEIVFTAGLTFSHACLCVLTGAAYRQVALIRNDQTIAVRHGRVFSAQPGDVLKLSNREYGLRTYLGWCADDESSRHLEGRVCADFQTRARWPDPEGCIRVLKGPEAGMLKDADRFLSQRWEVSPESSDMGLRLHSADAPAPVSAERFISAPVNDGTIQLTPDGPIILLRRRQTIGGYPRILNVIQPDVDLLTQYSPGQSLRFKQVSLEDAQSIQQQYIEDIRRL